MLGEKRKHQVNQAQVMRKQRVILHVHQRDIRKEFLRSAVQHMEVHETDRIDRIQTVVPATFQALAGDGTGGVVEGTVDEMLLIAVLHLHDELLAHLGDAEHVVDDLTAVLGLGKLLPVKETDITE